MNDLRIRFRSLFKSGNNNLIKIASLSIGLASGLVLIAKVYFEQSYNDFFPDKERIYQVISNYSTTEGHKSYIQTPGAVAVGMKTELPEVEVATRFTWLTYGAVMVTPDKKKYTGNIILGDSCLFDVFPRPVLAGDVKEVLSSPMQVMISKEIAEKMGGTDRAVGQTFIIDSRPDKLLTVGGVFEDIPRNSHLDYDVVVSMPSIGEFTWDGSMNWVGNDRYMAYVKLLPGIHPAALSPGIEKMKEKYLPQDEMEKNGVDTNWDFKPLLEIHAGDEETRRMALILSLLAAALLFTAVMNYVLIVISSLVNRTKEMAVNKCYGASGKNIFARMFLEASVDLTLALAIAVLLIFFFRGNILSLLGTTVNDLFTAKSALLLAGVYLSVVLAAAFIPGYLYARIPVATAFRTFTENKRHWKLGLLFIQFIAAGLFVTLLAIIERQYTFMLDRNPGYACENLAFCSLSGVTPELRQKALDETLRMSEVADVSSCSTLFFNFFSGNNIKLPGDERNLFNIADQYSVGNDYLKLMEIPVIEGRSFTENTPSSKEVMVSRAFVDKIAQYADWPDGVTGKNIYISEHSRELSDVYAICGVFEDVQLGIIGNSDPRPSVMFYSDKPSRYLVIKFHELTPEALQKVSARLAQLLPDKDVAVYSYAAEMTGKYGDSAKFRDSALAGGIIALLICLAGLTGYTNDEMNRRRKETAIRKVNGATIADVLRLFASSISRIAVPAIITGSMLAWLIANTWLTKFAEKASPTLPLFAACALAVLLVILAAVSLNCYRAASANPSESIKSE
ncbi:MAG: ABC transporter permease [Tannerellaceae bacterium]|jgi:putative ABC transport system permease protein|nr:ABC transporter permease [Tannerellaceae bacterium]